MFEISNESVKLVHLNIRTEKHGEDDVAAMRSALESVWPMQPNAGGEQ